MNVVALMGRLTSDPEVRQTPNGVSVCSFSIAVDRYTNGEKKADFINCVAWRVNAENIARFFKKGNKIAVNGSIQSRTFEDKETGKNRIAYEVVVDGFYFCEKAEQSQQTGYAPQPQNHAAVPAPRGNPRQNININPQPQQAGFESVQQGFFPTAVPKFMPQQSRFAPQPQQQSYPQGFEPIASDEGDMPF